MKGEGSKGRRKGNRMCRVKRKKGEGFVDVQGKGIREGKKNDR